MQYAAHAAQAAQVVAAASFETDDAQNKADMTCSLDNPEACDACGS
jgi:hypothetical protein